MQDIIEKLEQDPSYGPEGWEILLVLMGLSLLPMLLKLVWAYCRWGWVVFRNRVHPYYRNRIKELDKLQLLKEAIHVPGLTEEEVNNRREVYLREGEAYFSKYKK